MDSYRNNGQCNLGDLYCEAGDFMDCQGKRPTMLSPVALLLFVKSAETRVVIRGCTLNNLTLASDFTTAVGIVLLTTAVGIVNSTIEPKLSDVVLHAKPVSLVLPPDCSQHDTCDPRARCEVQPGSGVMWLVR